MNLAVVLGSGSQYFLDGGIQTNDLLVSTPFSADPVTLFRAQMDGHDVLLLPRHGEAHRFAPHEINYRANVWALQKAGAGNVVAVAACGGIKPGYPPGCLVVPHQIIDYTHGRAHTFSEPGAVRHIDFTHPYDATLREQLVTAAASIDETVRAEAVYAATQGPRLESAAEIDRLERDGCDIVGMTGMPEAALARELGLAYACCGIVVNAAAGRGGPSIDLQEIDGILAIRMPDIYAIVTRLLEN